MPLISFFFPLPLSCRSFLFFKRKYLGQPRERSIASASPTWRVREPPRRVMDPRNEATFFLARASRRARRGGRAQTRGNSVAACSSSLPPPHGTRLFRARLAEPVRESVQFPGRNASMKIARESSVGVSARFFPRRAPCWRTLRRVAARERRLHPIFTRVASIVVVDDDGGDPKRQTLVKPHVADTLRNHYFIRIDRTVDL